MIFNDLFAKKTGVPFSLIEVIIYGKVHYIAFIIAVPVLRSICGKHRMLHRKHQYPFGL